MIANDLLYYARKILRLNLQPHYRIPLNVQISLTNRCNNNCVYCEVHKLPQEDVWTLDSLKAVLSDMKDCGTKRIQFTGGEPMLRKDIGEIVDYSKSLGFFVGISTNGYQVSRRVEELKGIDVVFLSYDGPQEIHSVLRSRQNFDEVKSAIYALKKEGIRTWLTAVLTKYNAVAIEDIIDFARKEKVLVNFNKLEFIQDGSNNLHPPLHKIEHLLLRGREQKECFKELIRLKRLGAPIGSSMNFLQNGLEWPDDSATISLVPSKRFKCWAGIAHAQLEADANLYACGWAIGRIAGENVLEKGFRKAWNNLSLLKDCQSCSHACGVENNLIFSLDASTIINWAKSLIWS